jgi:hypothetical protein
VDRYELTTGDPDGSLFNLNRSLPRLSIDLDAILEPLEKA